MTVLAIFVSILLQLNADGSANVTENWDVNVANGTEWYLVKSNLGDIEIKDFSVSENGRQFITEGDWDVDRSMEEKVGRCGILRKNDGCELCWGLGSRGHHTYTARYTMTNVVKSLNDCDLFHMQLVSPGLSDQPENVTVRISAPEALDSGKDVILQKNEFSRWARRHSPSIVHWTEQVKKDAVAAGTAQGYLSGSRFTPEGQKQACRTVGFRKFLNDFTLIELRGSAEVGLWQDYLVFGALYGIADKVARELKEINPELFGETISYDYETTRQLIWLTRNMASGITNARAAQSSGASRGGFGGVSSFGGGGGFSGGGFGGGAR